MITPQLVPLLSQPDRVGLVSMTFIQDRTRRPDQLASRATTIRLTRELPLRALGTGRLNLRRLLMRNSTYHQIGKDIVIARTLQFGWIQRLAGTGGIPLAERFFAGGATSNRAFPDNQAGPRDARTGFPVGRQRAS